MFNLFSTIFNKITSAITSLIIAIGLVSVPAPVEQPKNVSEQQKVVEEKSDYTAKELEEIKKQLTDEQNKREQLEKTIKQTPTISKPAPTLTPEPKAVVAPEKLEISSIQVIPSAYEIVFKWSTNMASDSKLIVWPTNTQTGNSEFFTKYVTNHEIRIPTDSNKKYFYIIESEVNGKRAFVDQREVTTPLDSVVSKIKKTDISLATYSSVVILTIDTDEPTTTTLKYRFQATQDNEALMWKTVSEANPVITHTFSLPFPSYTTNTTIEYEFTVADRSSNSVSQKIVSEKLADMRKLPQ